MSENEKAAKRHRECDLYAPLRDWLADRGYEVHVELFGHDVIALKDGKATVIELKRNLSFTLTRQLEHAARWADFVLAAVASTPRVLKYVKYQGFGLLQIDLATGRVHQRAHAKQQPVQWHRRRTYRFKQLSGREPAMLHETAGLPSCPALRWQREMRNQARAAIAKATGGSHE